NRFDGDIDVHAVSTRCLRVALKSKFLEFLPHELRRCNDQVKPTLIRVEVEHHEVRTVECPDAAEPRVLVDATEVRQVQECCLVVANDETLRWRILFRNDLLRTKPWCKRGGRILLKKVLRFNPVGISLQ